MTNAADRPAVPAPSVRLPFAALVLAMLPAVLDQTILATALPTIATDLGRLSDVSWLVTAYVVAATASTPLWGKLGDRHGRKRLLQAALAGFVAASALCGAAQDLTQLVVVRGIQGLAAGGLMTLAMAAVGDLVAPRERGRYQGYIAATFAGATVLGPLIGGVLVEHVAWRWVFYVNLPVGAGRARGAGRPAAGAGAGAARPPPRPRRRGAAGGRDVRPAPRVRLGRRPLRVGLGDRRWPSSRPRAGSARPSSPGSDGRRTRSSRWRCCARRPSASPPPASSWPRRRSSRWSCSCPSSSRRRPARPRPRPGCCWSP